MGFLYATEPFAEDLGSILTFLRGTTRIEHWVGGIVPGLLADSTEYRQCGALGIMVGQVPEGAFAPFNAFDLDKVITATAQAAILHGDPRQPLAIALSADLSKNIPHVAGGLLSGYGPIYQLAGSLSPGGTSGVLLGPGLDLVTDLTQGCSPIGPPHMITKTSKNILVELDGLPALDVLAAEAGDLIARDWRRAAGFIHLALVKDGADYAVRTMIGIDPDRRMLATKIELTEGDHMVFVRRNPSTVHRELDAMLTRIKAKLQGRKPLGALYFSCLLRGTHMFGEDGAEIQMVRTALDNIPLLGFCANGELLDGQLYGFTGILALLVER